MGFSQSELVSLSLGEMDLVSLLFGRYLIVNTLILTSFLSGEPDFDIAFVQYCKIKQYGGLELSQCSLAVLF